MQKELEGGMILNAAMKIGIEVLRSAADTELNRDAELWKYQLRSNEEIGEIVLNFKDYLGTKEHQGLFGNERHQGLEENCWSSTVYSDLGVPMMNRGDLLSEL